MSKMMVFMAAIMGLRLCFYILLGFRLGVKPNNKDFAHPMGQLWPLDPSPHKA